MQIACVHLGFKPKIGQNSLIKNYLINYCTHDHGSLSRHKVAEEFINIYSEVRHKLNKYGNEWMNEKLRLW